MNKTALGKFTRYAHLVLIPIVTTLLLFGFGGSGFAAESGGHDSGGMTGHSGGSGGGHDSGSGGHDSDSGDSGHSGKGGKHGKGGQGHAGNHDNAHGGGDSAMESKIFDTHGRRPVWAGEGLPEVELGRLNAARAPERVLGKALAEAKAALADDPSAAIHAPHQNLALYLEAMRGEGGWTREQAAAFLGAAADKRIPITTDTVNALNIILGVSDPDPAGMAQAADLVRQGILTAHDAGLDTGEERPGH